eukprot:TRINITY_DN6505_c0_g2_i7.p1 TRINITY_DN6505_c0_g2~~TRINITY_DN6505_c0_g2_i7.p1  ORF type:complete len:723 (+),score=204.93 TRINITY_DN6505_c0_g2_i7:82-2250(+)
MNASHFDLHPIIWVVITFALGLLGYLYVRFKEERIRADLLHEELKRLRDDFQKQIALQSEPIISVQRRISDPSLPITPSKIEIKEEEQAPASTDPRPSPRMKRRNSVTKEHSPEKRETQVPLKRVPSPLPVVYPEGKQGRSAPLLARRRNSQPIIESHHADPMSAPPNRKTTKKERIRLDKRGRRHSAEPKIIITDPELVQDVEDIKLKRTKSKCESDEPEVPIQNSQEPESPEISTNSPSPILPPGLTHIKKMGKIHSFSRSSVSTQSKVIATKHFFAEYYWSNVYYLEQREQRLNELKDVLRTSNFTEEYRRELLQNHFQEETDRLRKRRTQSRVHDFQILTRIGRGGYGDVFLCKHKKTGAVYAMKRMDKKHVASKNQGLNVQTERDVMKEHISPWFVNSVASFQDHQYLYLVMEYIPGGDMRGLLNNVDSFPEKDAKFYLAEMILAVVELHKEGYAHRDLKPENFLISRTGHLKLGDFGLSKKGVKTSIKKEDIEFLEAEKKKAERRIRKSGSSLGNLIERKNERRDRSMVGSPNYMAIELLRNEDYEITIDYWSLGVIFFELVNGVPPFYDDTPGDVFKNIFNYQEVTRCLCESIDPAVFSLEARDFLNSLLCEPGVRLGRNGISDFQQHPYFAGFDWDNVRETTPPFKPQLSDSVDHSYFELPKETGWNEDEREKVQEVIFNNYSKPFEGFSFDNIPLEIFNSDGSLKENSPRYSN